jgi:hypothetical protein
MSDYEKTIFKSSVKHDEQLSLFNEPQRTVGGVKHDQEKPLVALIPGSALLEEAKVWTFGAKKYGNWNWANGLVYSRLVSAMLRHTIAIMMGEDKDPESGLLHAAHIRCTAGMLIEFHQTNRTELDDRLKNTKES